MWGINARLRCPELYISILQVKPSTHVSHGYSRLLCSAGIPQVNNWQVDEGSISRSRNNWYLRITYIDIFRSFVNNNFHIMAARAFLVCVFFHGRVLLNFDLNPVWIQSCWVVKSRYCYINYTLEKKKLFSIQLFSIIKPEELFRSNPVLVPARIVSKRVSKQIFVKKNKFEVFFGARKRK